MQLYLIRHGQGEGDSHAHCKPPVDGFLTQLGRRQASACAASLKPHRFDAIYASPLGRAIQTAQPLATQNNLDIRIAPWLIEWRPATVTGECDEASYENILKAAASIRPERAWKTPAGEGTLEMAHRVIVGFLATLAQHGVHAGHGGFLLDEANDQQRIAMVAHGGSLARLLAFLIGVPLSPYPPIAFDLTGVAVVDFHRRVDVWYPTLTIPAPAAPFTPE